MQKDLTRSEIIETLSHLGQLILNDLKKTYVQEALHRAYVANNWFIPDFTEYALIQIARHFLDEKKLFEFAAAYTFAKEQKQVAVIMAGNIPLAGFHDWLCVMVSGHNALVKCSSKDTLLLPFLLELVKTINPRLARRTVFAEQLSAFDAVIATGSNNSNRYFEYYFAKYPHIFRKNRSSVAVLKGSESDADLNRLSDDIFIYFGLGCRSVSKLYLPSGYNAASLLGHFSDYSWLTQHSKYMNNRDYNLTLLLMNRVPHTAGAFITLTESPALHSGIGVLHYEFYESTQQVQERLIDEAAETQLLIGADYHAAGTAQQPLLSDFADHVNTMTFLNSL